MSHYESAADEGVLIGRNHWDVPVRIELRAYLRFGRRMDLQLRRLVIRWAHAASPESRKLMTEPLETPAKKRSTTG
jgi:hypothetical protein